MRKLVLCVAVICVLNLVADGDNTQPDFKLPKLNTVEDVTLSPSYSCRSAEKFAEGYQGTALFLSDYAKRRNGPDLLFNGACGAEDYFEAATAGDDMSLIADLGTNVALQNVSASRAFNLQRVHAYPAYSKFARVTKVQANHTYAVLLNARDKRGLFVFTVNEYVPNSKVSLSYSVKSYQVIPSGQMMSYGFNWEQGSTR